jgi:hypothetical protein
MSIIRTRKRDNPFVQIDKTSLEDVSMSWKAKGLLAFLLSRPDDWQIYVTDLIKRAKDGRDAVLAGIKELEQFGYITRKRVKGERGRFDGWEYEVYEYPQQDSTENGFSENGETENGKPATTNNNLTNNNFNTTTTEDSVDKLANRFLELRGKGLILKAHDYQAINRVLEKVPYQEAIILLEGCFMDRPDTNINTFSYCEKYIVEHYQAVVERQKAAEAEKERLKHVEHPGSIQGSDQRTPKPRNEVDGSGRTKEQRLIGEDGEIPDTECDY